MINNYNKFLESKVWSGNIDNEEEATKTLMKGDNDHPLLTWLESKGYVLVVDKGIQDVSGGNFEMMGQDGAPYTFYLMETWTDDRLIN